MVYCIQSSNKFPEVQTLCAEYFIGGMFKFCFMFFLFQTSFTAVLLVGCLKYVHFSLQIDKSQAGTLVPSKVSRTFAENFWIGPNQVRGWGGVGWGGVTWGGRGTDKIQILFFVSVLFFTYGTSRNASVIRCTPNFDIEHEVSL